MFQQPLLTPDAATKAGERAITANNAVAGYHNRQMIAAIGAA